MSDTPNGTNFAVITPAQQNGIKGRCMAALFNFMSVEKCWHRVEELAEATHVKITTIPSLLRAIRQRGFKIHFERQLGAGHYRLDLSEAHCDEPQPT